ncbi:MAG: helix-turn-helix domain-containing protein [Treponema sp.]|nr:helix-turn-helix domain-containing protein [Treponema sp.]
MAFINDVDMMLTPKEFSLLLIFIKNEGRVLSAEYIYGNIWNQQLENNNISTLKKTISNLRKKIEPSGYTIDASYRKGYVFERI